MIGFPMIDSSDPPNLEVKLFVVPVVLLLTIMIYDLGSVPNASSVDIIRVPIAWCAVEGSQAASNPNIPNPSGGIDTTTNDVLWRRHERVTDNIYINSAEISFRSAINDPLQASLSFPITNDPDPNLGTIGNMTKEDFLRTEMKNVQLVVFPLSILGALFTTLAEVRTRILSAVVYVRRTPQVDCAESRMMDMYL